MRVRLEEIEDADLNVFDFDFDLTFMVFFIRADGHVYGRFGGRVAGDPDSRMSLAGLHYAMQAALDSHQRWQSETTVDAASRTALTIRDFDEARRYRGCIHCHQANEILRAEQQRAGTWRREMIWRFPPPDNLGFVLEVDRGDVVESVADDSPAARAGLKTGDRIERIGEQSVHSFGDVIYALDRAPPIGSVEIQWRRGDRSLAGEIELPAGWRKTVLTWRASAWPFIPYLPLHGEDLSAEEKRELGLGEQQLAFRQRDPAPLRIEQTGIRPGDVVIGIDGRRPEMTASEFRQFVRVNYLIGDRATVNLLRDGQRFDVPVTLAE